jgi:hypothetical protein
MKMLTLKIDTSNAAFDQDDIMIEIIRILHDLADHLDGVCTCDRCGPWEHALCDINGNRVGMAKLTRGNP